LQSHSILNEDRLHQTLDRLAEATRNDEQVQQDLALLKDLLAQLRTANENLVLATVKAQALQEDADLRNRRQNEFLAMLAHELRNPMAPISNAAQLLKKVTSAHPMLPKLQEIIDRQVHHMVHLLDDLLDASRIQCGKVHLQRSVIALSDVIGQAVELSRPSMEGRAQQLDIQSGMAPAFVHGDLVRLSQVFSNLLINASKYTQDGGRISLQVRSLDDSVIVTVRDNGRGIDAKLLPHVFDLFVQDERGLDRAEGGLGIGLSVAKGLVELHGGRITVRSDGPGLGSTFEVLLPLATARGATHRQDAGSGARSASSGLRILIMEDNADFATTLMTLLELEGHFVQVAHDGIAGLNAALAHPFDALICDIGLPRLNGYEVIAQVRRQQEAPRPLAIALSGYGQPEDRQKALDAGFDRHLTKPLQGNELFEVLATCRPTIAG